MKKWKKSGRKRKSNKKLYSVRIGYSIEEYFKINEYRIKNSYSWEKLANVALKEAVKLHKESEKKCVT